MRLIDADALPRHGNRGGIVQWYDIEKAPTVDAMPIDWIQSQVDKRKWAELVQRWAERKEE